jgi:hypothetical protein
MTDILKLIHARSPYKSFDPEKLGLRLDLQGWNSKAPIFAELLAEIRPQVIIEVGTWKGASAIHMARTAKSIGLDCKIICVDTWLGSLEFWDRANNPAFADFDRYGALKLRHGFPNVYYQFLANVVICEVQDYIVPFPQTSQIAAEFFKMKDLKANLIYLDGSHEEKFVVQDIIDYLPLRAEGGIIFGDDFDAWEGVRSAVNNLLPDRAVRHGFWVMPKYVAPVED